MQRLCFDVCQRSLLSPRRKITFQTRLILLCQPNLQEPRSVSLPPNQRRVLYSERVCVMLVAIRSLCWVPPEENSRLNRLCVFALRLRLSFFYFSVVIQVAIVQFFLLELFLKHKPLQCHRQVLLLYVISFGRGNY